MASLEDLEAVFSSELDTIPQSSVPSRKVALVLYDSSTPLAMHDTMIHRLDQLGHVVVAPRHPHHAITAAYGFSNRVLFYPTSEPYGPIDTAHWQYALAHALQHCGRANIFRVLILDNPAVLASDNIVKLLRPLKSRLNSSFGITIEAYRNNAQERYTSVVDRYESELEQASSTWSVTQVNGISTDYFGLIDGPAIAEAGQRHQIFARRFPPSSTDFRSLEQRTHTMLRVWQRNPATSFQAGERMFLTFANDGRDWNRMETGLEFRYRS